MKRDRWDRDDAELEDELLGRSEDVGEDEDTFDPFDDDLGGAGEMCDHGNHPATCEWCLEEQLEDEVDLAAAGDDDEQGE